MPRFHFDIANGPDLQPDIDGSELEGLNAARIEAVRLSGELLKSYPDRFWSTGEWNCTVRDESGLTLFVLHFFATGSAATLKS
ncbi:MAG TPA: hypothetical protein VGR32_03920 [Brevundimonas sp.]|jgi:hypothetical protein|uniref:DUF6894 family protein n=1 Tax=Brevundimonas sp. TaxID=1871086 RepID=UPI002DF365CC|nr:hypothetical protein [Brevundimonas sp.]